MFLPRILMNLIRQNERHQHMSPKSTVQWKVSLHGGHSNAYCDHASDVLTSMIEAAIDTGYHTFGVTEHAPRLHQDLLYPDEIDMGWTVETLESNFDAYSQEMDILIPKHKEQITLLKGFEAEIVPDDRYVEIMLDYRERYNFDYMVGSVHYVDGIIIDYTPELLAEAARLHGGLDALSVRYYELVREMVINLQPDVVGHLDLVRKFAPSETAVDSQAIRRAAYRAMKAIRDHGCILDLNTAGYRKKLGRPYPAPWLIQEAKELGIPFCFGDDSHCVADVGAGLERARDYLMELGVETITTLTRRDNNIVKKIVPLE